MLESIAVKKKRKKQGQLLYVRIYNGEGENIEVCLYIGC